MGYSSWSVVFGEQPSAAKWNILGTNDSSFNDGTGINTGVILPNHLFSLASTLNTWVWDSWSPGYTNITVGNGTVLSKYIKIGKTIIANWQLACGTTSSWSNGAHLTLPITANSRYSTTNSFNPVGNVIFNNGTVYVGHASITGSTSDVFIYFFSASASQLTGSVPTTLANTNAVSINFIYEAA